MATIHNILHKSLILTTLATLVCLAACDAQEIDQDFLEIEAEIEKLDDPAEKDAATRLFHDADAPENRNLFAGIDLEPVAQFNPAFGETPESVAVLSDNSLVVSMALTGEIRKIALDGTQSTLAVLPLGLPSQCQGPFPGIMGALAVDNQDNVYVGVSSCDPASKGIWRVTPTGASSLIASLSPEVLPNGIAFRAGYLYVADSASSRIWRAPSWGTGAPATVWTDEPLLADPNPVDIIPGANGLQFFAGSIYVANAGAGTIVEIPFEPSGFLGIDLQPEPGSVKYGPAATSPEHVTPPEFPGCDDFAFDLVGGLYCTTDPFQSVWRLSPSSSILLWTAADGLDGPTAAVFGRGPDYRKTLYISNAQFPFFPPSGNGPSILKAEMPVRGYPLR